MSMEMGRLKIASTRRQLLGNPHGHVGGLIPPNGNVKKPETRL